MPEERFDIQTLQGLQIKLELMEKLGQNTDALKIRIAKALDPDDDEVGIKHSMKKVAKYKEKKDIKIKKP